MYQPLICCNVSPIPCGVVGRSAILGRKVSGALSRNWRHSKTKKPKDEIIKRWKLPTSRAALADDAPFALAIGASILSTIVLPVVPEQDDDKEALFGPDDVRSGAMQIISFIPLFNWLTWVFAWLDTRQQRYLLFAIVYLLPYLKVGLSLSSDDSWLPISSVLACIVHVQLDISVNAEGEQSPLGDVSKVLREKIQIKDIQGRADVLVKRLKELAEKTEVQQMEIQENDPKTGKEWKAITEEAERNEFEEWDAKFAKSKAVEKDAKQSDP